MAFLPCLTLIFALVPFGALVAHPPQSDTKTVRIIRFDPPPVIDGDLSDPAWSTAHVIDDFTQVEPTQGAEPTEKTELRLGFDNNHIYIAIYCYDRDPDGIIATQMARDARLDPDDRVEFLFDTFDDDRNAFWFQIGPAGSRGDALIGGSTFSKDWDTLWEGGAFITDEGWFAELAIPTQSISFDAGSHHWGFNARRILKRREEISQWATPRQDVGFFTIGGAGEIKGLENLEQGYGIDFRPFGTSSWIREREDDDRNYVTGDIGGDLVWRITPSLTALFTANTDFAETEVDSRQVNLTRFPLFFPEKREFFLEDGDVFNFADLTTGQFRRPDIIPFFSRRIGLNTDGEEVRIIGGGKLTGRAGPYRIGVLDVVTDDSSLVGKKNLFASRISRQIWSQSDTGFIFTHGNPNEQGQNSLLGVDFNYRTTEFLNDKNLRASFFGLRSFTSGVEEDGERVDGDGESFGASVSYPNDRWRWSAAFRHIDDEFRPSLGFIRRQGIRRYEGDFFFRPRLGSWIRQMFFGFRTNLVTTTSNKTDMWRFQLTPLSIEFETGDEFRIEGGPQFETFDDVFEISEDIDVPGDDYQTFRYEVEFEASSRRPLSGQFRFANGDFLTGHRTDWSAEITWRPTKYFLSSLEYQINDIRLDEGEFVVRVARSRFDFNFSPQLTWTHFVQFDNQSDNMSINSRLRYILRDGQELFLVYNRAWLRDERSYLPLDEEATLKLQYVFRF